MYDQAYELAQKPASPADFRATYRKIDWRVTLPLCGIYFLQFIDKSLLNYSAVMGLKSYLKKDSNEFSNLGTILYVAYIAGEPINVYLFQRFPAAKLLSLNVICWGIVIIGHAFAKNYASLMVLRALLGLFESCVAPGCTLVTGMWYNKPQQSRRTCWWTCQAGVSTIFGGLLSYAFQHVHSTQFQSWQIFFLVMGLITVLWGIYVALVMPDSPVRALFLNESEKICVIENIRQNNTGTETKEFKIHQVREHFLGDINTWIMLLLTILSMIPTGAVLTFSVTIIANIGFSNEHAALMQMPLGCLTIVAIVAGTELCKYFKGKHRNVIFISMLVPAIIGYIVLILSTNKIGQLLAVYLINVGTCVITMIYMWNSANTAGYTKRVSRACFTMVAFAIGALIGPQVFRDYDAPRYIRAKIALLVIECVCIPLVLALSFVSLKENKSRDLMLQNDLLEWHKLQGEHYQFKDLTDRENIEFRYSY